MRIDKALVESGLVKTRSQAIQQIKNGNVFYAGKSISKPSTKIENLDELSLGEQKVYVGRGALKLIEVFNKLNLSPRGLIVADIGASTGGFTQVLLEREAHQVYAIDVGTNQLDQGLKENPRVVSIEGVNIREIEDHLDFDRLMKFKMELVVIDLSFISLTLCFKPISRLLKDQAQVVALVKPQFEVGREALGKGGLVKDGASVLEAFKKVEKSANQEGLGLKNIIPSPIKGKTGNQEFFFQFTNKNNEFNESNDFNFKQMIEAFYIS